ncbi:MAG TPA: NADPH:quinone oxidoreductase family protein [Alphaproteobacteria bacterium]|jgi:NADPH2:quinone reductase|nr:NADPH:quinone oxidoreductase family protein [Alphaproteobacteria bacterium]MDP7429109.1 NADPH:quinone oxidoreductase family protein [Alphaproteobacteria bacterium]HJM51045.1 NADPH:quinone oxidoreductase family protein [Alphaproteobacteria bacterium]
MKAILCERFGPPEDLVVAEVEEPEPGPGEIQIAVRAAGVGYVDGLMVQGLYQEKPPLPHVPGSEFAGVVAALGAGVEDWSVGDRVMGMASTGAFGEKLVQPAALCVATPDRLADTEAAGFLLNHATALHGLRDRGGLEAGETILVLGAAGGVGLATMAMAKALGGRIIAAASSPEKRELALAAGAEAAVDYSRDDWRRELQGLTAESGLQMVWDPVGGAAAEAAMRSLSWGGRHLVVGFASGTIPKVGLNIPLLKQCQIIGVDWGANRRQNHAYAMAIEREAAAWVAQGRLSPAAVTSRPLAEAAAVLRRQLDRGALGKVVLTITPSERA